MLALALALALSQSPTMAGPHPAAISGRLDYTQGLFVTGPSSGQECANANITTDQGAAITVTRASTAWCETSGGNMSVIDNDKPVVESNGLRVEASSSNRVAESEAISTTWTPTNATAGSTRGGPDGSTITTISTSSAGGFYQSATFTITGTSAVASGWVAGAGAGTYAFVLRDTTAGADRCTASGTPPASFTTMAARPSCSASGTVVSGNNHVLRVYPGGTAGTNSNIGFWGMQVEPAITAKTSYIKTSGTAATRAADNVSLTTDLVAAGCFSATVLAQAPAFPGRIISNPNTPAGFNGTTSAFMNDGTNTVNSNAVSDMSNRSFTVRSLWSGASMQIGLDGTMGTAGTFDGSMGSGTTIYLGSTSGTGQFFGGWLKKLKLGTSPTGCAL